MKKINIEQKSIEIQRIISQYTKESFVCFFADFIRHHPIRGNIGFAEKFKSKLKDSLYLIILRLSSNKEGEKNLHYSHDNDLVLQKVADILLEIVNFYLGDNYVEGFEEIQDQRNKLLIHELAFKDFFQNGVINYREQELNKVIRMFHPYQNKIKERLGIGLKTLIKICNHSEEVYRKKSIASKSFIMDKSFRDLMMKSSSNTPSKYEFSEELLNLPNKIYNDFLDFYERPYSCLLFSKEDYYSQFNPNEVDIFCELFSVNIKDSFKNLFYTQENPLDLKPIIKINDIEYLNIYQKQLPTALYNLLYQTLASSQKETEQLNRRRGKSVLEVQVKEMFDKFFSKERYVKMYTNYYIDENPAEKDILIIVNRNAYIIECKASRNREPRRNLSEAYQRIKSDFRDCIQNGYEQCYQVEKVLFNKDKITIKQNGVKEVISTSEINEIFSIVVTSERFASIQSDLGLLLKRKREEDLFPWSIYVDDLETFLISLKLQFNNPVKRFSDFLIYRELLNQRLITRDELDVCAMYLRNPVGFKKICENNQVLFTDPSLQNYFDELYFEKRLKFKILNL